MAICAMKPMIRRTIPRMIKRTPNLAVGHCYGQRRQEFGEAA
jgi:hypothetical protein